MKRCRLAVVLLCVGAWLALEGTADSAQNPAQGPQIGQKAPEIKGTDSAGKSFRLSDYRGKVVVLDFWGDW
jgi:cytochrome oxidase Cu insertion factor (SCO1/SenC/PrrC family)